MIDKLVGLWDSKRWLFWLLLPLTAFAFGIKYYLDYLEYKASRDLSNTNSKNQRLRYEQQQLKRKAKEEQKKAKELEDKIEDRKEEDVDEDWHLK